MLQRTSERQHVASAEADLKATQDEAAKIEAGIAATADSIRADIARLEAELSAAEKNLPADFRGDYDRVVKVKGADGMSDVEDGVCNGCGQKITPNMQNELVMSRPTFCKACGRLLYLPE